MTFRSLIIGSGFGARVVQGCYEEAGMEVEVVSARDGEAVRRACDQPLDLVSVHSPPFLHAEHVNLALDHGHNVLCDKPFGTSAAEAQQMLDRAREKGVIHLLNFEFRHDPGRKRVKEIIDSGAIGKVVHIHWNFFNCFSRFPPRAYGWQFDRDRGGGWIRINSTHMIDAMRWLVGELNVVDARGRIDLKDRADKQGAVFSSTAEDAFSAFLDIDNGASVVIDSGWAAHGTLPDRWTILGSEGMIDIVERVKLWVTPMSRETEIRTFIADKEEFELIGPFAGDAHLPAMRPFAVEVREAVSQRRQIEPSFEAGLAASKVVDDLHAALARRSAQASD